jgi:hypothetical protein
VDEDCCAETYTDALSDTDQYTLIVAVTPPNSPLFFEIQSLSGLCHYVEHNLNYQLEPSGQGTILSDPQIGSLVALDRFVWSSLATPFAPFRISGAMCLPNEHEQGAPYEGHASERWKYTKSASLNSFCHATLELAAQLPTISHFAATFDSSNPAAAQLVHAPHLRLLLDTFFHHPIRNCGGRDIDSPTVHDGLIKGEIYNDFVTRFRRAMLDRKLLRRELHNWTLGSGENAENLRGYLDGLFARHDSLTVLHLCLFHARERVNLITAPVDEQHCDLQALRTCRARFFDRIRRKPALFTDNPGYIWAILPSLEGGYKLHLTLLFDTAALKKVLDDKKVEAEQIGAVVADHADQVGAYWVKGATGGRGSYLRGDQNLWAYGPDWVHGEVRVDDVLRRKKLLETLGYLTMRRALVRLKYEPRGEYFGMRERKARAPRRSVGGGEKAR